MSIGVTTQLTSVNTSQIVDGAVTSAKIASGAVVAASIAAGSVGTAAISSGAATSGQILQANLDRRRRAKVLRQEGDSPDHPLRCLIAGK